MTTLFAIIITTSTLISILLSILFWSMINAIRKSNNAKARYYNLLADEMEIKYENYVD